MLTRTLKHGMYGLDVQAHKRGIGRALEGGRLRALDRNLPIVRNRFGRQMQADVKRMQALAGIPATGVIGPATHDLIYDHMDDRAIVLLKQYADSVGTKVPPLGPIVAGGKSILLHDLTHRTDGDLEGDSVFPAFDDGFGDAGRGVVAPEQVTVYQQSGSQGGDAFYIRGTSKIEYWIGHVHSAPATGRQFNKGEQMAVIGWISASDGGPHVHCGINAKPLIGRELEHHTNYTHGAKPVGKQLEEAL